VLLPFNKHLVMHTSQHTWLAIKSTVLSGIITDNSAITLYLTQSFIYY